VGIVRSERLGKIEQLFSECVQREAFAYAAFLDEACSGDFSLRREVEALLAADADARAIVESVIWRGTGLETAMASWEGKRIGPYQIIRELGRGGMGVVFLASRADGQFDKQVAIKMVAGIWAGPLLARFRQERQILAGLEHPNIARLLDGGVTPEGTPYLVMEYVQGEPLLAYCDRRMLSIPERLKLFRVVCSAVQYAHQNLVVHRDLKPANILVTSEGVPKLLDFGVAKLLPRDAQTESAATLTAFSPLTPQYASPEQVQGGPISTATDVYALGALLYELLSGRKAHLLRSLAPQEIARAVCGGDTKSPSDAVGREDTAGLSAAVIAERRATVPERLRKRLRGDLDDIVLRALRKEPVARYSSVEGLSDDVRRYLEGLPVVAHRGRGWYQSRKFIRRHAVRVAAGAAAVLALIAFALITRLEMARVTAERDNAAQVADFMVGLFSVNLAEKGKVSEAVQLLLHALDLKRRTEAPPLEVGSTLVNIAEFDLLQGDAQSAEPMARAGLAIYRKQFNPQSMAVVGAENVYGRCLVGLHRYEEAEPILVRLFPIIRKNYGDVGALESARALMRLYQETGRPEKASQYRALVERDTRLTIGPPSAPRHQSH
jgi:serine/threonine protein kinase